MIELKLAGNHLDREAVKRALLRRQARQLQRVKEQDASWRGEEPLWLIAPHLPSGSMPTREELLWRFGKAEDPEARRQRILGVLLEASPQKKQQLIDKGQLEGRLTATRASLRLVLANRQLTPSRDDDAHIDACTDLATLEHWLGRAINATSVSDVLR